jgi:hypothetical protein
MKKKITYLLCLTVLAMACSKNNGTVANVDCSGGTKSFVKDVSPIIQAYCATSGCHASGSTHGPGALTTWQQIYNSRASVRASVVNRSMPQNSSLSASQINTIVCWIDNGATNN